MSQSTSNQEGTTAMSFYVLMNTHEFNGRRYPELMLPELTRYFWSTEFMLLSERPHDQISYSELWKLQGDILGSIAEPRMYTETVNDYEFPMTEKDRWGDAM